MKCVILSGLKQFLNRGKNLKVIQSKYLKLIVNVPILSSEQHFCCHFLCFMKFLNMIEIFVVQYFTYRIINLTLSMSKYQSISTRQKSKITSELLKKIVVNTKSKKMQTFHLKSSLVKPPAVEEATSRW